MKKNKSKTKQTKPKRGKRPVVNTIQNGEGLINDLVDNLPFEMHAPGGYNYLG